MYVVMTKSFGELVMAYQGRKPFIGTLKEAKRHADYMKQCFPDSEYTVHKLVPLSYKGVDRSVY
jgi:hypothetical protein